MAPLTPHSHVLRATDATSLPAQAQTSQTLTKERSALLLEPGIPTADNMTISSWVHFPLPSDGGEKIFQYNSELERGSPLRRRRHRWATLYYGTGQVPGAGDESGDEGNHVCILHFEDNMNYTHGQGTETGAQFGIMNTCSNNRAIRFEAFEVGNGETQQQISGLSDGWHLVTLVTAATLSPLQSCTRQDRLFVDGKVRVLPPLRGGLVAAARELLAAVQGSPPSASRLLHCCTVLGQGVLRQCQRAVSDHGDRWHTAAAQGHLPTELHCHRYHHRLSSDEHGRGGPRRLQPGAPASADSALGRARVPACAVSSSRERHQLLVSPVRHSTDEAATVGPARTARCASRAHATPRDRARSRTRQW